MNSSGPNSCRDPHATGAVGCQVGFVQLMSGIYLTCPRGQCTFNLLFTVAGLTFLLALLPLVHRASRRVPEAKSAASLWSTAPYAGVHRRRSPLSSCFCLWSTPGFIGRNLLSFGPPCLAPGSDGEGHHSLRVFAFGSPRLTPGFIGRNLLSFGPVCLAPGSNGEGHI